MILCTLTVTDNNCPFVSANGKFCQAKDTRCSFRKEDSLQTQTPAKYVRKPRWYEQYQK